MKRFMTIIIVALLTLIVGAFALIPFNGWIWDIFVQEGGYDEQMKMFDFLFFIEWPILLIFGGMIGNWLYKKYLTKASNGQSKSS